MTNTSHKDTSTNSYTNTTSYDESDDLIPPPTTITITPKYSFEDLPSERDYQYSIFELLIYFILKFLASFVPLFIVYYIMVSLIKLFSN